MNIRICPINLVFISGIHGCGKDTLIKDFLDKSKNSELPYKIIRYEKCEMTSFDDIIERQVRRIAKYVIDYHRAEKIAKENPDSIVITDRCIWDAWCYIKAFKNLNWLSKEDADWIDNLLSVSFDQIYIESIDPILLLPPIEFVKNNLYTRQQSKGAKWNETDMDYLNAVYNMYKIFYNSYKPKETILITDREQRVECLDNMISERWKLHIKR